LPEDAPVDTVRADPVRKGLLFAGTETSVWVSFDDGDHWQSLQLNLPHTSMRDLWIHDDDLIVGTHGRSFWILDDIMPLRGIPSAMAINVSLGGPAENPRISLLLLATKAYRVRRSTYTDTPIPPDEPLGQNPPDGAIIDYFIGHPATDVATLEILDAQDRVVRRFSSTDKPDVTMGEVEKQHIPLYWIRMPKTLSAEPGMHRWVWDLHYPAPVSVRHEFPISAVPGNTPRVPEGPRALPGEYQVRLTANGVTTTAPLTIKEDPRVKTPAAGLEQQFKLQTRLASMMTRSSEAIFQARAASEQLDALTAKASGALADAIKALDKKIGIVLEGSKEPAAAGTAEATLKAVNEDVFTLYAAVDRADAAPTAAQVKATDAIEPGLAAALKRWEEIKASDLAELNRQLKSANLPEIRLDSKRKDEEESDGDEG
jgi:hypothetical protein